MAWPPPYRSPKSLGGSEHSKGLVLHKLLSAHRNLLRLKTSRVRSADSSIQPDPLALATTFHAV
jgi:hypothetical protein